jgi:hypothetical protein
MIGERMSLDHSIITKKKKPGQASRAAPALMSAL